MNNKKLTKLLDDIKLDATKAENNKELLSAVEKAVNYGSELKYDLTLVKTVAISSVLVFLMFA